MLGNFGARVGAQASNYVHQQVAGAQMNRMARSHPQPNQPAGQVNHLNIQRPCEQLPPSNIRGDVQSHIDAEELNVEGVSGGLVPQQRIPLPNQLHQQLPRAPSHDSFVNDPGE